MFGINQLVERPMFLGETFTHGQAQHMIEVAFANHFGRLPEGYEGVYAQAVALCETGYGASWDKVCGGAGSGSYNMGALQVPGGPPCNPDISFPCGDTHEDGTPYGACFRKYPTAQAGMNDFVRVLYKNRPKVFQVAKTGSVRSFSTELRASKYFELPLEKHITALTKCLNTVTTALHEPMPPIGGAGGTTKDSGSVWPWIVAGGAAWYLWRTTR